MPTSRIDKLTDVVRDLTENAIADRLARKDKEHEQAKQHNTIVHSLDNFTDVVHNNTEVLHKNTEVLQKNTEAVEELTENVCEVKVRLAELTSLLVDKKRRRDDDDLDLATPAHSFAVTPDFRSRGSFGSVGSRGSRGSFVSADEIARYLNDLESPPRRRFA